MKKLSILLLSSVVLLSASCKKEDTTPADDTTDPTPTPTACELANQYLPDVDWKGPVIAGTQTDTFHYNSNGNFYRNGANYGTWSFSSNCDTIIENETGGSNWQKPLDYITADSFAYSNTFGYQFVYRKIP